MRNDLKAGPPTLDRTDRDILDALVKDARRSASEIGRLVGLSPPAAKRRIVRLEGEGVIRGYAAALDHGLLGENIEAFIELRLAPGAQVADIETAATDLPEVVESFTLAETPTHSRACECATSSTSRAW